MVSNIGNTNKQSAPGLAIEGDITDAVELFRRGSPLVMCPLENTFPELALDQLIVEECELTDTVKPSVTERLPGLGGKMAVDARPPVEPGGAGVLGVPAEHSGSGVAPPSLPANEYDLTELISGYELCGRAEGKSLRYLEMMRGVIKLLVGYLRGNNLPIDVRLIAVDHLRSFIVWLQARPVFADHPYARKQGRVLSATTVNDYLRTVRAFWSWSKREGIINENVFDRVKVPPAPIKTMPVLSEGQLRAILSQPDVSVGLEQRDFAIMTVLLDTMVRSRELRFATLGDIDRERLQIHVVGKGRRERWVPIARSALKALWHYVTFNRPLPAVPGKDFIFLSDDGHQLTKNRLENIVKRYALAAGVTNMPVSPHVFRRSGATLFIKNNGSLLALQRILGHSRVETTARYVNLSGADLGQIHAAASPLDNLGLPQTQRRSMRTVKNAEGDGMVEPVKPGPGVPTKFNSAELPYGLK